MNEISMDGIRISELKSRFSKSHNSTEVEIAYSPQTLDFLMIILAIFIAFIIGLLIHRIVQVQRHRRYVDSETTGNRERESIRL